MTEEQCLHQATNRVSYVCIRSAELRKETQITNHDAFVIANEEWREIWQRTKVC
jgi:hypothetical protein